MIVSFLLLDSAFSICYGSIIAIASALKNGMNFIEVCFFFRCYPSPGMSINPISMESSIPPPALPKRSFPHSYPIAAHAALRIPLHIKSSFRIIFCIKKRRRTPLLFFQNSFLLNLTAAISHTKTSPAASPENLSQGFETLPA